MAYLMESKHEAERLLIKSEDQTTREQLILTGLKPGMKALDAGGGVGFVSKIMSEIVGSSGQVTLVDQSGERLSAAQKHCAGQKNLQFVESPLEKIPLDSNTFDYVFCRFVFEYLPDTKTVFKELFRLVRPGGKLVIGDLDHNLLNHHPLPNHLQSQLEEAISKLIALRFWDPYAGRKLYSMYYREKLENIKVHLIPHHLFYGEAPEKDVKNWEFKLLQMRELSTQGILKLSFNLDDFCREFMVFFKSPERFSYTPLILVEGVKSNS